MRCRQRSVRACPIFTFDIDAVVIATLLMFSAVSRSSLCIEGNVDESAVTASFRLTESFREFRA
jgi:hypothetical protein